MCFDKQRESQIVQVALCRGDGVKKEVGLAKFRKVYSILLLFWQSHLLLILDVESLQLRLALGQLDLQGVALHHNVPNTLAVVQHIRML